MDFLIFGGIGGHIFFLFFGVGAVVGAQARNTSMISLPLVAEKE
jgi:hypothetical protein